MAPLGPFGPHPALAIGVSGGPHSLALAWLAHRWACARGGSVLCLVVDHGLRTESAAEAAGVAGQLAARGLPVRVLSLGLQAGPALHERAREGRFAALLEACRAEGRPWLLLGQHQADQAETLLMRLLAGSGPAGLAAMAALRPDRGATVLRPLLAVSPVRLETTCAAAGLAPVRDPSNSDPRFLRARLRAALADPDGIGDGTLALAEAAHRFAGRADVLNAAVAERLAGAARLLPTGHAVLDRQRFGTDRVAAAALGRLVRSVAGSAYAPAEEAAAALLGRGEGTLGGALLQRGRQWVLAREAAAMAPPLLASPCASWDGRFRLLGAGDPGATLGPLGAAAATALRDVLPRLPAVVLATVPAIRRKGVLVAVPLFHYPDVLASAPFTLVFAPQAGAVTGR